jgi:hypothetical protein
VLTSFLSGEYPTTALIVSTDKLPGWRPSHTKLLVFTSQTDLQTDYCSESESELLYFWRFTANQFVLTPNRLRITTREFFYLLRIGLPLGSVGIAHTAQVSMVMGNTFSSQETVTPIKVIIWNKEPLVRFDMCL